MKYHDAIGISDQDFYTCYYRGNSDSIRIGLHMIFNVIMSDKIFLEKIRKRLDQIKKHNLDLCHNWVTLYSYTCKKSKKMHVEYILCSQDKDISSMIKKKWEEEFSDTKLKKSFDSLSSKSGALKN